MAVKKRHAKGKSPHPGVVLKPRTGADGSATWRAHYWDPDHGREVAVRLDPLALPNAESRKRWAIAKATTLAKRRMELESGAPRKSATPVGDAIDAYFKAHERLRPRTLEIYRAAGDKLRSWAAKAGVHHTDDITRARLLDFRQRLADERKRVAVKGGRRGEWSDSAATGGKRSPAAVNQELRAVKTLLLWMAERDWLTKLSTDDISRGLRQLEDARDLPVYLDRAEIKALLNACLAHDREKYAITREEHAGLKPIGSTHRYAMVGPLVLFALLGGCRAGEVLGLDWGAVDLSGAGCVHLKSGSTKTKRGRLVSFAPSPVLHGLLQEMKKHSGDGRFVFGGASAASRAGLDSVVARLIESYGAPKKFSLQVLRATCSTFSMNSPGLFGTSSAFAAAKRAGHAVAVAEARYAGLIEGIPASATTLEAAMEVEGLALAVVASVAERANA